MELFYEQCLSRDYGKMPKFFGYAQQILLIITVLSLAFTHFVWSILIFTLYLTVIVLSRSMFLEYEYELVYNELIISKIINKKSRKVIGKIDVINIIEVNDSNNFSDGGIEIVNASIKGCGLVEKILFVRENSKLIGYRVAMDKKLYEMCKKINPLVF